MAITDEITDLPDAPTAGAAEHPEHHGVIHRGLKWLVAQLAAKLTVPATPATAGTDIATLLSNLGLRAAGAPIWAQQSSFNALAIFSAAVRFATSTRTAAVTLSGNSNNFQFCDATSGAFTVTLSGATTAGQHFHLQKTDASANAVTIAAASGQTINGAPTYALPSKGKRVTIVSDGTSDWKIVESN